MKTLIALAAIAILTGCTGGGLVAVDKVSDALNAAGTARDVVSNRLRARREKLRQERVGEAARTLCTDLAPAELAQLSEAQRDALSSFCARAGFAR